MPRHPGQATQVKPPKDAAFEAAFFLPCPGSRLGIRAAASRRRGCQAARLSSRDLCPAPSAARGAIPFFTSAVPRRDRLIPSSAIAVRRALALIVNAQAKQSFRRISSGVVVSVTIRFLSGARRLLSHQTNDSATAVGQRRPCR